MVFVDSHVNTALAAGNPEYQLIEYYASACPHCKTMAPVWNLAHKQALTGADANTVQWAQKECYGNGWVPGKDFNFCKEKGIEQFPTIVLEKTGTNQQWEAPPLTGATRQERAEQLNLFVAQHTGSNVKESAVGTDSLVLSSFKPVSSDHDKFKNFI